MIRLPFGSLLLNYKDVVSSVKTTNDWDISSQQQNTVRVWHLGFRPHHSPHIEIWRSDEQISQTPWSLQVGAGAGEQSAMLMQHRQ